MHRDIKTNNILITKDKTYKIGDLGVSVVFSGATKNNLRGTACGTPSYYAPEIYINISLMITKYYYISNYR